MSKTVNQLVIESMEMVSVLEPDEIPQSGFVSRGISIFNDLLASFGTSGAKIPFYTLRSFNTVSGQQDYVISPIGVPDLTAPMISYLESCNLINGFTSYPVQIYTYPAVDIVVRTTNNQDIPGIVVLQRGNTESTLSFYDIPDSEYQINIRYKPFFTEITAEEDLSNYLPPNYFMYLQFALAKMISLRYPDSSWTAVHQEEYERLENEIEIASDFDLSVIPSNIMRTPADSYYQSTSVLNGA